MLALANLSLPKILRYVWQHLRVNLYVWPGVFCVCSIHYVKQCIPCKYMSITCFDNYICQWFRICVQCYNPWQHWIFTFLSYVWTATKTSSGSHVQVTWGTGWLQPSRLVREEAKEELRASLCSRISIREDTEVQMSELDEQEQEEQEQNTRPWRPPDRYGNPICNHQWSASIGFFWCDSSGVTSRQIW